MDALHIRRPCPPGCGNHQRHLPQAAEVQYRTRVFSGTKKRRSIGKGLSCMRSGRGSRRASPSGRFGAQATGGQAVGPGVDGGGFAEGGGARAAGGRSVDAVGCRGRADDQPLVVAASTAARRRDLNAFKWI